MKNAKTLLVFGISVVASCQLASSQVIVNETFDYADLAGLQGNWGLTAGLGLDTVDGQPLPSATHSVAAATHNWIGSVFSITPTAANPIILTADIFDSGIGNQRNTVGLRTGANPLFEMGMYNAFTDPAPGSGEGVRVLNLGGNQGWHQMGVYTTNWSRWEATFTDVSVTVRVDTGIDSIWDLEWISTGVTPAGAFTDLRFGGPSALLSAGGGFAVDNIRLEVIPEPSVVVLATLGGLAILGGVLRRRAAR